MNYDELWNVYVWNRKHAPNAIRIKEAVPLREASFAVDAYLAKGLDWDAYMVQCHDDPGYVIPPE